MAQHRLRVALAGLEQGERLLPPDAARYVARVHRLRPGDRFLAFDPEQALEADAQIVSESVDRHQGVLVELDAPRAALAVSERAVTLIQAMGKGTKVEAIVRDATELGVTRLVAVIAERTIKRPSPSALRVARWRRIAVQAARQCGRGDVPELGAIVSLAEALARYGPAQPTSLGLCLHPDGSEPLGELLRAAADVRQLIVVVGPEGGLSPAELELARTLGYRTVRLGGLVMRTETACAAVMGALLAWAPGGQAP